MTSPAPRGASQHTCASYAYSFQLLFEFAATKLQTKPSSLSLEQLDSKLVSAFLEYLEDTRRNAPETRNVRLAAIKSFFHFLEHRQPAALEQIRRVLAIPFKKTSSRAAVSGPCASGHRGRCAEEGSGADRDISARLA